MPEHRFSRRTMLAGVGAAAWAAAAGVAEAAYADRFAVDRSLVILPTRGRVYVASDFHARWGQFNEWLERSDLIARLKGEPDVYGVILGDAVDVKRGDPEAIVDGDSRIIDRIREIQAIKDAGRRLIYISGNHDYEVARLYSTLEMKMLAGRTKRKALEAMYAEGMDVVQFNFVQRITEEQYQYIRKLPLAVLAKNGVVMTHAGPSRTCTGPDDVAREEAAVHQALLWGRPVAPSTKQLAVEAGVSEDKLGLYHEADVDHFLKVMENSSLLLTGHNPHSYFPAEWMRDGLLLFGKRQAILATSLGALPDGRRYLVLDLARRYDGVADLVMGKEILKL